jgi:hypothetical protein
LQKVHAHLAHTNGGHVECDKCNGLWFDEFHRAVGSR